MSPVVKVNIIHSNPITNLKEMRRLIVKTVVLTLLVSGAAALGVNTLRDRPVASVSVNAAASEDTVSESDKEELHEVTESTPDFIEALYSEKVDFTHGRFANTAVYNGSFRSELTDDEKIVYDGFVENYIDNRRNESVTVYFNDTVTFDAGSYDETLEMLTDRSALSGVRDIALSAVAAFYLDHPDVFWIRSFDYTMTYRVDDNNVGYLESLTVISDPAYTNAYDDLHTVQSGIRTAVSEIEKSRASVSRYDTLRAIHDYIAQNASYDNEAAASTNTFAYGCSYTAAPVFGGGTRGKIFVCEGYSKALKILCDEFNIPAILVVGTGKTSSGSGAHMWNYVQMEDGNWYGVDVTWDDSLSSDLYFLVGSNTKVLEGSTFGQDHLPNDQIMTANTRNPLAYPSLSAERYTPLAVDPADMSLTMLGANIRVSDPYGIRFGVQIAKDEAYRAADIVEYGTLIIASNTLGSNELTLETENVRRIEAVNLYSEDDSQITYTGVLVGIPGGFFGTNVKGRGYLIYRDADGQEQVIYSDVAEKSFYGVAQTAYNSYSNVSEPTVEEKDIIVKLKEILDNR